MSKSHALSIDIGGTHCKFGIISQSGEVLSNEKLDTRDFPEAYLLVKTLYEKTQQTLSKMGDVVLDGVGVGAPNANYYSGQLESPPNLPWKGSTPLKKMLHEAFNLPVAITNDANIAALGEMYFGKAKDIKDFAVITLGTGLGSGFVTNGKLIYGHDSFAGEMGHINVVPDGRICNCGKRGCLETYVSVTGLKRTAMELMAKYSGKTSLSGYSYETIGGIAISEAARSNDPLAIEAFNFTGKILGYKLADLVALLSPKVIFITGGLAKSGDLIMKPTQKYFEENLLNIYKGKTELINIGLSGQESTLKGGAALLWEYIGNIKLVTG
ncbi:MAG: ROK family protein [Cyclobacteriaceae bacterium]|nr:ROK family protein [Cyclobacteriaceae bacterium]MCH8515002.1 ROK family protein [Cyclobacteriaceae bacterium]